MKFFLWILISIVIHLSFFALVRKTPDIQIAISRGGAPLSVEEYSPHGSAPSKLKEKTGELPTSKGNPSGQVEEASEFGIPAPDYPRLSRLRGEEGDVLVSVILNEKRELHSLEILQSSDHPLLDQAVHSRIERSFEKAPPDSSRIAHKLLFKFRLNDGKH